MACFIRGSPNLDRIDYKALSPGERRNGGVIGLYADANCFISHSKSLVLCWPHFRMRPSSLVTSRPKYPACRTKEGLSCDPIEEFLLLLLFCA